MLLLSSSVVGMIQPESRASFVPALRSTSLDVVIACGDMSSRWIKVS